MSAMATLRTARPALAAFWTMGVLWGTFAAVLPDLKTQLGVDEAGLGLLLFTTPLAATAAMLLAPWIGARLGRVALPVATLLMAATFMLPGQAVLPALFVTAMLACGAGTGLTDVLMNARVTTLEARHARHLMNLCHAAYSFGYAAGAVATGLLRDMGWGPAWVMGTMALLAAAFALMTGERDGTIEGLVRPRDGPRIPLGPVPVFGGAIVLIAFLTENAAENWSALHIEKTLGGSAAQGAMGPAALALTMGLARLAGQGLIARVSPLRLLGGGCVIAALGAMTAALAASPAMAYAGFVVMGIGASVIAPTAFTQVGRLAHPDLRALAVARATLLGYFGYFFGPPALGFVAAGFGLRMAFTIAAVLLLSVLVLAPLMLRARA